jgi:hypothetical protein
MLNTRQNYHHSKLPKIGQLVLIDKQIQPNRKKMLAIVLSFPLCDNCLPYSKGIHTVNIRILADNSIKQVSGFWLTSAEY